jgi:hypothetical protein
MNEIVTTLKEWMSSLRQWWGGLAASDRNLIIAGVALTGIFVAGGLVLQGLLIGAMVNAGFWYGFWSPKLIRFMEKAGWLIDVIITIGVFAIGGAHGMVAGLFIAVIFSICRRILIVDRRGPGVLEALANEPKLIKEEVK